MEKQEMTDKLRAAIAEEFELEEKDIAPDAPIKETLDLDSLSLVDLIALIEVQTGVKLKGVEVTHILTFEALYDFVYERM
ncbi:MAG: acyl carrier protein [Bacteroidales bacterium]|nr:acyl carrier protein [Bacteroidales bacterium]